MHIYIGVQYKHLWCNLHILIVGSNYDVEWKNSNPHSQPVAIAIHYYNEVAEQLAFGVPEKWY